MPSSSPVRTVYLLRHTQTVWNAVSRYQGRIDTELSDLGTADVETIARQARPGDFEAIYCSPLGRARSLAECVGEAVGCRPIVDERLTEIAMGPWEGLTRAEIESQFPETFAAWQTKSDEVQFPGGESLADVAGRVRSFAEDVFESRSETSVLVVSHDAVIKVALMLAIGLELRYLHRFRLRNGSVSILRGRVFLGSVETVDSQTHLSGSPFRLPS